MDFIMIFFWCINYERITFYLYGWIISLILQVLYVECHTQNFAPDHSDDDQYVGDRVRENASFLVTDILTKKDLRRASEQLDLQPLEYRDLNPEDDQAEDQDDRDPNFSDPEGQYQQENYDQEQPSGQAVHPKPNHKRYHSRSQQT